MKISSLPCNDFIKPTEKERTFRLLTDLFSLSACVGVPRNECNELWGFTYTGLDLAHSREPLKFYEFLRNPEARLTGQMRCSLFAQNEKFSAKDITLLLDPCFL